MTRATYLRVLLLVMSVLLLVAPRTATAATCGELLLKYSQRLGAILGGAPPPRDRQWKLAEAGGIGVLWERWNASAHLLQQCTEEHVRQSVRHAAISEWRKDRRLSLRPADFGASETVEVEAKLMLELELQGLLLNRPLRDYVLLRQALDGYSDLDTALVLSALRKRGLPVVELDAKSIPRVRERLLEALRQMVEAAAAMGRAKQETNLARERAEKARSEMEAKESRRRWEEIRRSINEERTRESRAREIRGRGAKPRLHR